MCPEFIKPLGFPYNTHTYITVGVQEATQSLKSLLHKCEDLSSDSQGPNTSWAWWYVPPIPVLGRPRDRRVLGFSWPATLSESETAGFSDRSYLKKLR